MEWVSGLAHRLRSLLNRRRLDADLNEELAAHLAFKQESLEAEGLAAGEASRQARLALGNATAWKERTREQWILPRLEGLWRDVVFGSRRLAKDKIFTTVALLTLALGIGANTAVFTLLNSLLWRALPVREPGELVRIRVTNLPPTERAWAGGRAIEPSERRQISFPMYEALGRRQQIFDGICGRAGHGQMVVEIAGVPCRLRMSVVTGTYFAVLGVEPAIGRLLSPADDIPGGPPGGLGIVISHSTWSNIFARRADIVGTRITAQQVPFTIIGVAPPHFHGVNPGVEEDFWLPLSTFETLYPKGVFVPILASGCCKRWHASNQASVSSRRAGRWKRCRVPCSRRQRNCNSAAMMKSIFWP
jgi:hypothetical protein